MSALPEICFSFTALKHAGIGTLVSQMNLGSLYNCLAPSFIQIKKDVPE